MKFPDLLGNLAVYIGYEENPPHLGYGKDLKGNIADPIELILSPMHLTLQKQKLLDAVGQVLLRVLVRVVDVDAQLLLVNQTTWLVLFSLFFRPLFQLFHLIGKLKHLLNIIQLILVLFDFL